VRPIEAGGALGAMRADGGALGATREGGGTLGGLREGGGALGMVRTTSISPESTASASSGRFGRFVKGSTRGLREGEMR
jgi:hypothetical protein